MNAHGFIGKFYPQAKWGNFTSKQNGYIVTLLLPLIFSKWRRAQGVAECKTLIDSYYTKRLSWRAWNTTKYSTWE